MGGLPGTGAGAEAAPVGRGAPSPSRGGGLRSGLGAAPKGGGPGPPGWVSRTWGGPSCSARGGSSLVGGGGLGTGWIPPTSLNSAAKGKWRCHGSLKTVFQVVSCSSDRGWL